MFFQEDKNALYALVLDIDKIDVSYSPVGNLITLSAFYKDAIKEADGKAKRIRELESSLALYKVTGDLPESATPYKMVFARAAATTGHVFSTAINKASNLKINSNAIANDVKNKAVHVQKTVKQTIDNPLKLVQGIAGSKKIARIGGIVLTGVFNRGLGVLVAAHSAYLNREEIAKSVKNTLESGKSLANHFVDEAQRNSSLEMPGAVTSQDGTEFLISGNWLSNKDNAKKVKISKLGKVANKLDL